MLDFKETKQGVAFKVKVQPRAAKNELCGVLDEALKVRLTAPPVEGEANQACLKFLATVLGVPKSSLRILNGETGRLKTVEVLGLSVEVVKQKLSL